MQLKQQLNSQNRLGWGQGLGLELRLELGLGPEEVLRLYYMLVLRGPPILMNDAQHSLIFPLAESRTELSKNFTTKVTPRIPKMAACCFMSSYVLA